MTNSLLVSGFENNLETEITTLLDKPPPDANTLLRENSGVGSVYAFIQRTLAEFSTRMETLEMRLFFMACKPTYVV